jgi:YVTN family beta-propeller protein
VSYSLGIDLGTTFVAAAVARDGRVDMLRLGDASTVMRAAICVRDDGVLVSGDAAARRAVSDPDRVAWDLKRHLGDPTPVVLGGVPYTVTALLGTLLRDVLARAVAASGGEPDTVMLTHPANWGPLRRKASADVPRSADLTRYSTVTEPEAAATYYSATRQLGAGQVFAVYDLGGGTFDATVLRRTAEGTEVLGAPEGIDRLGGTDFDEAVLTHVDYVAGGALRHLDMSDPRTVVALARLRQDCTAAKEALSFDTETTIPVFLPGRQLEVRLTRGEFEDLIRMPVESTLGALSRTLRTAGIAPGELSAVLLVGGSSHIPLIAEMVSQEFGCPTIVDAHPKHAVALGAAIGASARAGTGTDGAPSVPSPRGPEKAPAAAVAPAVTTQAEPAAARRGPSVGIAPTRTAPATASSVAGLAPPPPVAPPTSPSPHPSAAPQSSAALSIATASTRSGPAGPSAPRTNGRPTSVAPDRITPTTADTGQPPGGQPAASDGAPLKSPALLSIVVLAVVVLLGVVVLSGTASDAQSGQGDGASAVVSPGAAGGHAHHAGPPPVPQVAASVPDPSVARTVEVGETPGFVAAIPDGSRLYVANRGAGVITVVDTATDEVTATIPVPAGPPQFLTFAPDGTRAYVSVWDDGQTVAAVSVVDTTTNRVVATIPVPRRPYVSAVSPDGRRVYVPDHDQGVVSVLDTDTNALVAEIRVRPNPHWVELTPDGTRAYVANHDSDVVSVIDTDTDTVVDEIPVEASPHSVAVHRTRPLAANVNYDADSVTVIDTDTNEVVATVDVGRHPQDVTWSADGRFAYVTNVGESTVSVISTDDFRVTATIPTGTSPTSVTVLPDGSRGYVSDLDDGTLTVLDLAG